MDSATTVLFADPEQEPRPGYLVKTNDGYLGVLMKKEGDQWEVFLASGLNVSMSEKDFRVLSLSDYSTSPASFHEILKARP